MDTTTKEIMNECGYENWTSQPDPDDYKISKAKLDRSNKALMVSKQDRLARDVAAYDQLRSRLPLDPPGRTPKR